MKNWNTHIKTKYLLLLVGIFLILSGCEESKQPEEIYVAEVGNVKLSQSELEQELGNNLNISKYRDEYIRDWIETEILFQISKENNLLKNNNYQKIINNSQKELAASFAINDYLNSNPLSIEESELRQYFNENRSDYNFPYNSYILNYAEFNSEESAINFRSSAIVNGWSKSIRSFLNDSALVTSSEKQLYKFSEIQSERTLRVLKKLYKNEISFVINTELNNFVVVQQLDEIAKNSTPKFQYVQDKVRSSLLVLKQRKQIRQLLDSLINQKNVKIY